MNIRAHTLSSVHYHHCSLLCVHQANWQASLPPQWHPTLWPRTLLETRACSRGHRFGENSLRSCNLGKQYGSLQQPITHMLFPIIRQNNHPASLNQRWNPRRGMIILSIDNHDHRNDIPRSVHASKSSGCILCCLRRGNNKVGGREVSNFLGPTWRRNIPGDSSRIANYAVGGFEIIRYVISGWMGIMETHFQEWVEIFKLGICFGSLLHRSELVCGISKA